MRAHESLDAILATYIYKLSVFDSKGVCLGSSVIHSIYSAIYYKVSLSVAGLVFLARCKVKADNCNGRDEYKEFTHKINSFVTFKITQI